MKNKRADIPIMILVLGVLLICALTIISFLISKGGGTEGGLKGLNIRVFEEIYSDVEKFNFYVVEEGLSKQESAEKIGAHIEQGNLVIEKEKNDLSIKYIVP